MRARAGTRARREEPVALTARQEEVLRLLERGLTNTEIAAALAISLDGAKFHVSEIIGKLGVATREEAVEAWRQRRRTGRLRSLFSVPLMKWGAVAAGAGGLAAMAIVVALSSGDDTAGLAADTPEAQATATAVPESTAAEPALAACPEPLAEIPSGTFVVSEWMPIVVFNGVTYHAWLWDGPLKVAPETLGPPYGEVAFTLSGVVFDPAYVPRDCDASWLPAGTLLYTIDGYSPRFRIATEDGEVYEAYQAEGTGTAGEILELRGTVRSIEFRTFRDDEHRVLGKIGEATELGTLIESFLAAPYERQSENEALGPRTVLLVFVLQGGTDVRRVYDPDSGYVEPGIWLPESFNEAARAAIGARVE